MSDQKSTKLWGRRLRRSVIALFALAAVAIDFHGDPFEYFSYFTVLTNLGIALWFLLAAANPRRWETASLLRLALTIYGLVTFLVYWIVLSPTHHPQGWNFWANLILHLVMPLAMAFEDLLVPWPKLKPAQPLWCLVFPVVWALLTLVRAGFTGWYPYDFLDAAKIGGWGLLSGFLFLLLILFVVLAYGWRFFVHLRHRNATAK